MKKGLIYLLTIILLFSSVIGVICIFKKPEDVSTDKVKVIATLFPQYDFAKQIGGDKVQVSLLLTPGTETHSYEPTPQDMIDINKADLFIYTGENMEPWADKIAESITSDTIILDVSKNVELIKTEHEEDDDDHEHEETEEDENHEGHEHHHEHEHSYDPHIWLNPENAVIMVNNIKDSLCEIDPDNKDYYEENAKNYIDEINMLDEDITAVVQSSKSNKIAFGGTFAYKYFVEKYNLDYISAYDSCGENAEPSVAKVKSVIDYVKKNNLPVVFYQEQSSGKIAETIANETGAQKLVFHTVHNVSPEELKSGETYVSLMRKNLENIKKALN